MRTKGETRENLFESAANAVVDTFKDQRQRLAFVHGADTAGRVAMGMDPDTPILELLTETTEIFVDNPVTTVLQKTDEFALGALLALYEIRGRA